MKDNNQIQSCIEEIFTATTIPASNHFIPAVMFVAFFTIAVYFLISTSAGSEATQVISDEGNDQIDLKVCSQNIAILRGRDGRDGLKGEKGDKGECQCLPSGGLVFTRWGKSTCPDTDQTELIYKGLTVGSSHNVTGGGANYMCLSRSPDYGTGSTPFFSPIQTAKYKGSIKADNENQVALCAVCYTPIRSAKLIIPGEKSCPSKWTKEYSGYLMSDFYDHKHNSVFECIDEDMDGISADGSKDSALLYHTATIACTGDLPCPPYVKYRPITCVVCTK